MASFRFNYRVETYIEADSMKEAVSKFENMQLPENVDFVEVVSVEDGDTMEDLTDKYNEID